jgi:hypothetical protein
MKTQIQIEDSTRKRLALFKIDWEKKNYDEVIKELIRIRGDKDE